MDVGLIIGVGGGSVMDCCKAIIMSHIMETYFSYPVEDNPADDVAEGLMRGP